MYAKSPQFSRHSLVDHPSLGKKKDSPSNHSSLNKKEKVGAVKAVIFDFSESIFIEEELKIKENNLKKPTSRNPTKPEKSKKHSKKIENKNSKTKKAFQKFTSKSLSFSRGLQKRPDIFKSFFRFVKMDTKKHQKENNKQCSEIQHHDDFN